MAPSPILLILSALALVPHHHRHGHGELTLSTDGNLLIVDFVVDAETAGPAMASAEKPLQAPSSLFALESSPSCQRTDVSVTEDAPHDESDDAHSDHSDVLVSTSFTCRSEPTINAVTVTAFDLLPKLEKVAVTVLTSRQQAEVQTDRRRPVARFP